MTRIICSLLMFVLLIGLKVNAQHTDRAAYDQQRRQLLGMSEQQYVLFSKGVKQFNKRSIELVKDTSMNNEKKKVALENVRDQKIAFINSYLNEDQRKRLYDFERNAAKTHTPRQKQQKEHEERLKKKGIMIKPIEQ